MCQFCPLSNQKISSPLMRCFPREYLGSDHVNPSFFSMGSIWDSILRDGKMVSGSSIFAVSRAFWFCRGTGAVVHESMDRKRPERTRNFCMIFIGPIKKTSSKSDDWNKAQRERTMSHDSPVLYHRSSLLKKFEIREAC